MNGPPVLPSIALESANRSGGLMLYYVLVMALSPVGALLCVAGSDEGMPWGFFAMGVVASTTAVALLLYCFRRDAWNTSALVLVFSVLLCTVSGVLAWKAEVVAAIPYCILGLTVAGACSCYLAWRRFGLEEAPDMLVGDGVMEIDGIAIRIPHKLSGTPGGTAWVCLELQNAWTSPIEFRAWLRPRGAGVSEMPRRITQVLGPLEAGFLRVPMTTRPDAKGRIRIRISVNGQGRAWLARRGRLRPKSPVPVGPIWLLAVMGAAAGEALLYQSASFELVLHGAPEADPESLRAPGASTVWQSTWAPPT